MGKRRTLGQSWIVDPGYRIYMGVGRRLDPPWQNVNEPAIVSIEGFPGDVTDVMAIHATLRAPNASGWGMGTSVGKIWKEGDDLKFEVFAWLSASEAWSPGLSGSLFYYLVLSRV